jgi:hypothetical protein
MSEKSERPYRFGKAASDDAFADQFIDRNREALDAELKAARASIRNGKGKRFETTDDLVSYIAKVRRSRREET